MPHVVVKMYPGRTPEQKAEMTEAVKDALIKTISCLEDHLSIDIIEVEKEDWQKVYDAEIKPNMDRLAMKPKY